VDNPFQWQLATIAELRRLLGPYARGILVDTPQGRFLAPVEDLFVGGELRMMGRYALSELNLLRAMCNPNVRLLVVGANIGALAVPLASVCKEVTAIEANPRTFEFLALNVQLNKLTNVRLIQKAASNRAEMIDFLLSVANPGGSKRKPVIDNPAFYYDNPETVKVEAVPLDDLLPGEIFDIALMDIEGSEYFALQGMHRILASLQVLEIEFLPDSLRDVAGISVAQFLQPILPHFSVMLVPSRRQKFARDQFESVLSEMYQENKGDAGLLFFKENIPPNV
jgi:FkbM family methyltransferase